MSNINNFNNNITFTSREKDVLNVLWEDNKPLTAKEIVEKNPSLSINTVQSILKKLLNKKYIQVAEIVYSGTVLTRSYEPILTINDYISIQIVNNKQVSFNGVMAALLKKEKNEVEAIEKLEILLKQYKDELKKD